MVPPVTAGSWSDWIHASLVMGGAVDPAPGSHTSSVSTAAVSSHNSLGPCRSTETLSFWPSLKTCQCLFVVQGDEADGTRCSSSPDPGPVLCEVPCSRDCVLSDWTSWSTCSQTCSSKTMEGKQMRMRSILAYNAGEGVSNFSW